MANKIVVPENPTPAELSKLLAICSNEIATLADLTATYKQDAAIKATAYKRELAKALIRHSGSGNVSYVKAKAETDGVVMKAQDELDMAEALYTIAKAELDAYDAQFVALRKIAEIRKTEMSRLHG